MARVNVYIEAGNNNRTVCIGGRKSSSDGYALINTNNAFHDEVGIGIRAYVEGEGMVTKERRQLGRDDRVSRFTISLPHYDKIDRGCSIDITIDGYAGDNASLDHVNLPGGITLAHALACVETVRRLQLQSPTDDSS